MWYTENICNKAYILGSLILIYPIPQKDCLAHLEQFFLLFRKCESVCHMTSTEPLLFMVELVSSP